MRYLVLTAVLFFIVNLSNAQLKSKSTLIGVSTSVFAPACGSKSKFSLGIPSFSCSASLENRFSLNKKLNFSYAYSLNYFNVALSSGQRSQQVTGAVQFNQFFQACHSNRLVASVGNHFPLLSTSNLQHERAANQNSLLAYRCLNPFVGLGVENQFKINNRNLLYSIQYQVGANPSRTTPSFNPKTNNSSVLQGVHLGIKYKY